MRIQNNLQEIRWSKNLTTRDVARKAGLSHSTVSHIENQDNQPSLLTAYCIAHALNEPLESIFPFVK